MNVEYAYQFADANHTIVKLKYENQNDISGCRMYNSMTKEKIYIIPRNMYCLLTQDQPAGDRNMNHMQSNCKIVRLAMRKANEVKCRTKIKSNKIKSLMNAFYIIFRLGRSWWICTTVCGLWVYVCVCVGRKSRSKFT